jgi:uncharacterized protein (DUF2141 family)
MFFAILGLLISPASAAELTLNVQGVDDDQGEVRAVVCDEATFLTHHCPYRQEVKAAAGDAKIIFPDIPPGTWAVLAFHDSNSNKDLDMNFLGIPTEQFGFSGNPGFMHRPKFAESAFTVDAQDLSLDVQLSK